MKDGILIIDKPAEWTSHDVVRKLRKLLKTKRIGHTGTLDPFATGVLVMLVGQATRLAQFLDKDAKEYEATIQFGFETDTGDFTGSQKSEVRSRKSVSLEEIERVLPEFLGEIEQVPPMYSAKKVEGKKLYELARKGVEIERKPVNIMIDELEVLDGATARECDGETKPKLEIENLQLRVVCGAGTYIRTLAEDISRSAGTLGHLTALRRTRAGKFSIAQAVKLEDVEKAEFISMNEAVSHLPKRVLSDAEILKVRNGLAVDASFENEGVLNIRMIDEAENLVAIGEFDSSKQIVKPRIVFQNQ